MQIRVRAAGVNPSDWNKRQGVMDEELPQTLGYEAAGVVDEIGTRVADVAMGDRVFGFCPAGAAQAELAVLSVWARIPAGVDFVVAAALPAAVETAARALDALGVTEGSTVVVNGASGNVGSAAVQLAVARGARVIGTASPATHERLRSWGAEPVAYGDGMVDRIRVVAPGGVDRALDVAGNGVLGDLVDMTGGADDVVTVADFDGARQHGVRFSRGDSGRADYALGQVAGMVEEGRYHPPAIRTFPLSQVARAHHVGETGASREKLVLTVG